jgi:hypothetical protein
VRAEGAAACCADATFDKGQRGFLFVAHVRGEAGRQLDQVLGERTAAADVE